MFELKGNTALKLACYAICKVAAVYTEPTLWVLNVCLHRTYL